MGVEKSMAKAKSEPEIELYLIYTDPAGNEQTFYTKGFKKLLSNK